MSVPTSLSECTYLMRRSHRLLQNFTDDYMRREIVLQDLYIMNEKNTSRDLDIFLLGFVKYENMSIKGRTDEMEEEKG